jgi:hypothetical protein
METAFAGFLNEVAVAAIVSPLMNCCFSVLGMWAGIALTLVLSLRLPKQVFPIAYLAPASSFQLNAR